MVTKGVVLLGVEHLQQRRRGIAVQIGRELIHLVEHQQRVHGAAGFDPFDDTAGHRTYVGLAVTADIRLVPHAAQTQPGDLSIHGLGDREGDRGFADARRADKAKYLPLGVCLELTHGDKLQDSFFDLLHAEMVAVEDPARGLHVGPLLCLHAPGHFQTGIQIVAQDGSLRAAKRLLGQALDVLEELLLRLRRQLGCGNLAAVFVQLLVAVALADLMLEHLDLLAQDKIALNLSHAGAHLTFNVLLHRDHIHLTGEDLIDAAQAVQRADLVEHGLLVLIAQADLLSDEIGQITGVGAAHDNADDLLRQLLRQFDIFAEVGVGLAEHGLCAVAAADQSGLLDQLNISLQKRLALPKALESCAAFALHHHADDPVGHAQDLCHARNRADLI